MTKSESETQERVRNLLNKIYAQVFIKRKSVGEDEWVSATVSIEEFNFLYENYKNLIVELTAHKIELLPHYYEKGMLPDYVYDNAVKSITVETEREIKDKAEFMIDKISRLVDSKRRSLDAQHFWFLDSDDWVSLSVTFETMTFLDKYYENLKFFLKIKQLRLLSWNPKTKKTEEYID